MKNPKDLLSQQSTTQSTTPETLPNLLYHTHLQLASHSPPQHKPSSSPRSSHSASANRTTMVTHIADQTSDSIKVQTASTVQYRRAHLSSEVSEVIHHSPTLGVSHRHHQAPTTMRPNVSTPSHRMRHVRHPSNLPLYTPSPRQNTTRSRRLRESLKPLFQIFSPTEASSSPPLDNRQWDETPPLRSRAKVLQESNPNTLRHIRGRSVSASFSDRKGSHHSQSPLLQQRPVRNVRREETNAAVVEELKREGLLGGGPTKSRKRKGRADSPDLAKPLPPLVTSLTTRDSEDAFYWEAGNTEEKYWADVADDIARRVSMLS